MANDLPETSVPDINPLLQNNKEFAQTNSNSSKNSGLLNEKTCDAQKSLQDILDNSSKDIYPELYCLSDILGTEEYRSPEPQSNKDNFDHQSVLEKNFKNNLTSKQLYWNLFFQLAENAQFGKNKLHNITRLKNTTNKNISIRNSCSILKSTCICIGAFGSNYEFDYKPKCMDIENNNQEIDDCSSLDLKQSCFIPKDKANMSQPNSKAQIVNDVDGRNQKTDDKIYAITKISSKPLQGISSRTYSTCESIDHSKSSSVLSVKDNNSISSNKGNISSADHYKDINQNNMDLETKALNHSFSAKNNTFHVQKSHINTDLTMFSGIEENDKLKQMAAVELVSNEIPPKIDVNTKNIEHDISLLAIQSVNITQNNFDIKNNEKEGIKRESLINPSSYNQNVITFDCSTDLAQVEKIYSNTLKAVKNIHDQSDSSSLHISKNKLEQISNNPKIQNLKATDYKSNHIEAKNKDKYKNTLNTIPETSPLDIDSKLVNTSKNDIKKASILEKTSTFNKADNTKAKHTSHNLEKYSLEKANLKDKTIITKNITDIKKNNHNIDNYKKIDHEKNAELNADRASISSAKNSVIGFVRRKISLKSRPVSMFSKVTNITENTLLEKPSKETSNTTSLSSKPKQIFKNIKHALSIKSKTSRNNSL
ncbi:hypothetical protein BB561_003336 [Smittium simulii]|uniref:Uncharacterized protein n=1 Tax=Smittium simulii TaxID=133385 RepID=A0A2T9YLZ0_9FUNG|nr:hypothetical protein BB561_003336 [Smittium simulii]